MVQRADIQPGDFVLEPSAGLGAIARHFPFFENVYMVEKNHQRICELRKTFPLAKVWEGDFITLPLTPGYNKIIMNPPFEDGQDMAHVRMAYTLLNPGGRIVAIMSPHAFFANDKKSVAFREWFTGTTEDLPAGTFKASGTNVIAKLVVIDKP